MMIDFRIRLMTYFTKILSEIVKSDSCCDVLDDFTIDPLLETPQMNF